MGPAEQYAFRFNVLGQWTTYSICTGMAPPSVPEPSAGASTSTGTRTSSRSRGADMYVQTLDDDIRMEGQDDERTSRRTRSVSRKRGVISPREQGPPAQRARVEDPVGRIIFHPGSCFTIKLLSRMAVGRVKRSLKSVYLFRAGIQPGPAMGAHFQGSGAIHWQCGPLTLSLSPSRPRKGRRTRKRYPRRTKCPQGRQRARGRSGLSLLHQVVRIRLPHRCLHLMRSARCSG